MTHGFSEVLLTGTNIEGSGFNLQGGFFDQLLIGVTR